MKLMGRHACWVTPAALAIACALSAVAWAGGSTLDDEHDPSDEDGLIFFGFVKDTRGGVVSDAKVTIAIKAVGEVITRSNVLGAYRITGFRSDTDLKTIKVLCEKQGYKYVRSFQRSPPNPNPKIPIELECVLQRA
jgi:hypothetical protein